MVTAARRVAAPVARRAPAAAAESSGYSGAAGIAKMQEEQKRAEAAREMSEMSVGMPFRFFCPVGDSRELVVVDDAPSWFRYEHNMKNPRTNKWDVFTACLNEHTNCPACKVAERPAYFALFLTVIDLTPYVNRDDIEVPWSKKLLCVKPSQQKKIMRFYERHGTLRGLVLVMTRDSDKDAAIGNDIEENGWVEEADLQTYVDVYVDKKDKEHEVIGHEVFDYDALFPRPTEEQLRAVVGGRAEPGSRAGDRETLGGSRRGGAREESVDAWDRGGDTAPAVRRRAPDDAPTARSAVRRAVQPAAQEEPLEVEPRQPVRRTALRTQAPAAAPARAAPARSAAPLRRAAPVEAEDPPQRISRAAPARRVAPAEPVEEAQPASSLADRRRAARGR